jgi:hypothetical protein
MPTVELQLPPARSRHSRADLAIPTSGRQRPRSLHARGVQRNVRMETARSRSKAATNPEGAVVKAIRCRHRWHPPVIANTPSTGRIVIESSRVGDAPGDSSGGDASEEFDGRLKLEPPAALTRMSFAYSPKSRTNLALLGFGLRTAGAECSSSINRRAARRSRLARPEMMAGCPAGWPSRSARTPGRTPKRAWMSSSRRSRARPLPITRQSRSRRGPVPVIVA